MMEGQVEPGRSKQCSDGGASSVGMEGQAV